MITDLIINATHTEVFRTLAPEFGTDMDYTMLQATIDNVAYTTYKVAQVFADQQTADLLINVLFWGGIKNASKWVNQKARRNSRFFR